MLIIDGTYLIYKSFYRTKNFHSIDSEEESTIFANSARNSFLRMVSNLKKRFKPSEIFIVFDGEGPTFREKILPSYKAHRKEKPDMLLTVKNEIYSFLKKNHFPFQISENVEADDLISSFVHQNPNKKILIFTGDSDLGALVNENVTLLLEKVKSKSKGKEIHVITIFNFHRFFKVPPSRLAEFKALQGDKSDFIKKVEGLLSTEVFHLLMEYPSIEDFFNRGQLHPLYERLLKAKQKVLTNVSVTRMLSDCKITPSEESFDIKNIVLPPVISKKVSWE